jgi:hypothetical protein
MNFGLGHGSRHPVPNVKCVTLGPNSPWKCKKGRIFEFFCLECRIFWRCHTKICWLPKCQMGILGHGSQPVLNWMKLYNLVYFVPVGWAVIIIVSLVVLRTQITTDLCINDCSADFSERCLSECIWAKLWPKLWLCHTLPDPDACDKTQRRHQYIYLIYCLELFTPLLSPSMPGAPLVSELRDRWQTWYWGTWAFIQICSSCNIL